MDFGKGRSRNRNRHSQNRNCRSHSIHKDRIRIRSSRYCPSKGYSRSPLRIPCHIRCSCSRTRWASHSSYPSHSSAHNYRCPSRSRSGHSCSSTGRYRSCHSSRDQHYWHCANRMGCSNHPNCPVPVRAAQRRPWRPWLGGPARHTHRPNMRWYRAAIRKRIAAGASGTSR